METQLKKEVLNLKNQYLLFWIFPLLAVLAGEFEILPTGCMVDNVRGSFLLETMAILATAISVPLALKLFSWVMAKKIDTLTLTQALRCYRHWCFARLALLEVAVILNLLCYYLTMNSTGALCALIGLTASFFCIPSHKRLSNELHLDPIINKYETDFPEE